MEVRGVVLFFEHGLPKKNEGPGNGEAVGRLPFAPDIEESTPGLLGRGAFHEAVSGRFLEPLVATVESCRVYYKGKVMASPKSGP